MMVKTSIITKNTYAFIGNGATVDGKAKKPGIDVRTGTFGVTLGSYLGVCLGGFFMILAIVLVPIMVLPPFFRNR